MKTLNIFTPGKHTSNEGAEIDFAEDILVRSAEVYDPKIHEAPIVIGHPKTDDPAFGWIKGLYYNEQTGMEAEPHQVNQDFADMVNSGAFKKISASFYTPDSPINPVPGTFYLRHVGFLGAQPPAVKGMRAPSFAEGEEGVVEFNELDFSSPYTTGTIGSLFRRIREWIISEKGVDEADKVIPDYYIQDIEDDARRELDAPTEPSPAFSEPSPRSTIMPMTEEELRAAQEKLQADQAAFAESQTALQAEKDAIESTKKQLRRDSYIAFADSMIKEGKVAPAEKDGMIAYMESLSEDLTVEFGEGDGKTSKSQVDMYKDSINARTPKVDFDEASNEDGHQEGGEIDEFELQQKAVAYQERLLSEGTHINIAQAVNAVLAGKDK